MKKPIYGIMTMVPTVFDKKGDLDIEGFKENLRYLEDNGMHGIITTSGMGEHYQLNGDEYDKVVDAAVDACKKMTCVCGSQHQTMGECIRRTKYAENAGADGVMVYNYHYNKPDYDECHNFYRLLHDATSEIQIMIYNYAPECKGFNMTPDLFDRLLRDYDRITGSVESVFDAPEGIIQATELIRRHGDRINVLSLNEVGLYPTMMIGGKGCMSVYGLAMPRFQLQLYKACEDGDWEKALELHRRLTKFPWETGKAETLFPGTVTTFKAVLEEAGRNAGPPRPPYSSATKEMRKFYRDWLKDIGAK